MKTKWFLSCLLSLVSCFLFSPAIPYAHAKTESVAADLINTQGEKIGNVSFAEEAGGVRIKLEVEKLSPGPHAFHIHGVGQCEPPDFKSAGSHFNPYGKKHGIKNPAGPHAGDLPNLMVGADGTGKLETFAAGVTIKEGPYSLFNPKGTALVIHEAPDDEVTDPAGNAGARVACGVITWR